MGILVSRALAAQEDVELTARYDPAGGEGVTTRAAAVAGSDVVVEFTRPEVVMENLESWRQLGIHAVVGTSGFGEERLEEVRRRWEPGPPNCLIAPNFSIGAVLMMHFAELAAPHFHASEVIELHHDGKVDAPSGTAVATAGRLSQAGRQQRRATTTTGEPAARGASIGGVPVHAVRLPGLVAHQEVLLGAPGETLTIRHDTTDRSAFLPGVLLAVRQVAARPGLTVGLEALLGL